MSPTVAVADVERFQEMVGGAEKVGVSEFSRSKAWRTRLPELGCFEVVDRNGVVGYMLAPACAQALSERLDALEAEAERAQVAALLKAREGYADVKTGSALVEAVDEAFGARIDALLEAVDAD